ncbi:MAG: alpha/beta fold hydrolase [bacterium]
MEDIRRLREFLDIEGKVMLWGGSWGSTLALAFAETYPELVSGLVLRGVFLGTRAEIEHFYHGGVADLFPDVYERLQALIPEPERHDYPRQLFELTQSEDPEVRQRAIDGWAAYEIRMSRVGATDASTQEIVETYDLTAFSVLENYYMSHGCFLSDDQLLRNCERIAHLPTFIVNGRFDAVCQPRNAWELAKRLDRVEVVFSPAAGHSGSEPNNVTALLRGTRWVADRLE